MKRATKSIIITGGNTGLGLEAAKVIAGASSEWHVIVAARSQTKGTAAVQALIQSTNNPHISSMELDLSSLASIQRFAERFSQAGLPPLHAIICNAGAQFVQNTQVTVDGFEATFGVNHIGHFLLVRLLLPQLQESGRILIVSSDTHDPSKKTGMPAPSYFPPAKMADPAASDNLLDGLSSLAKGQTRYTTSKLCNLYFAYELSRRIVQTGSSISVMTFNPGMMPGKGSSLARDYSPLLRFMWNHVLPLMRFFRSSIRTTKQSGADLANLILRDDISSSSGTYWDGPKKILSSEESYNRDRAMDLWNWTSKRLKLEADI